MNLTMEVTGFPLMSIHVFRTHVSLNPLMQQVPAMPENNLWQLAKNFIN
jgi:hypothetical protein